MTRAVLYLRVSLDKTGDGLGIERQRQDCRRLAEQRGWQVVDEIVENDTSATYGKRLGFERLLELMSSRQTEAVVVWHIDRLLRKMTDLERVIEVVEKSGVRLTTVSGEIDLSTDMGRMVGRIMASVARAEVERKSARHKRANRQKAEAGKPHGGRRPYGYQADFVTIEPSEAAVLHQMADKLIAGQSYKQIAYWLNDQGHKTTTAKAWYPITVRNLFTKKRYAGVRTYQGADYPATWPAIFDDLEWEKLQLAIRLRNEEAKKPGVRARKYLLTGLVVCGKCGNPLNGELRTDHPGKPKRRIYFCRTQGDDQPHRGCGGVRRNADALDDWLAKCVLYRLDSPQLTKLLAGKADDNQLRELLRQRDEAKQRLDVLITDYATGLLSRPQFARAKQVAESGLEATEAALSDLQRQSVQMAVPASESLRQAWQKADTDWRRKMLSLLVERVVVRPGRTKPFYELADGQLARFDPELITINWRV